MQSHSAFFLCISIHALWRQIYRFSFLSFLACLYKQNGGVPCDLAFSLLTVSWRSSHAILSCCVVPDNTRVLWCIKLLPYDLLPRRVPGILEAVSRHLGCFCSFYRKANFFLYIFHTCGHIGLGLNCRWWVQGYVLNFYSRKGFFFLSKRFNKFTTPTVYGSLYFPLFLPTLL